MVIGSPAAPLMGRKLDVRLMGGLHVCVDGEPLDVLRSARASTILSPGQIARRGELTAVGCDTCHAAIVKVTSES